MQNALSRLPRHYESSKLEFLLRHHVSPLTFCLATELPGTTWQGLLIPQCSQYHRNRACGSQHDNRPPYRPRYQVQAVQGDGGMEV
jgi:hypothetical protein